MMEKSVVMGMSADEMFELENDDIFQWIYEHMDSNHFAKSLDSYYSDYGELTCHQIEAVRDRIAFGIKKDTENKDVFDWIEKNKESDYYAAIVTGKQDF